MASSEMTNFYEALGVFPNATPKDINNAYKRLALKYHPDKVAGGDVDKFHKIQEAAETLRDPDRRRIHDYDIKAFRIRNYYKLFGQTLSRNNNNTNYNYNQQYPQNSFYSKWMPSNFGSYNMGTGGYTYMYSYKNSVHMNPTSNESAEEQERYAYDRKRDEEIKWRMFHQAGEDYEPSARELKTKLASTEGLDPMAWGLRRQEAMRARIARDEEDLKNEKENQSASDQEGEGGIQGLMSINESESEEEGVGDMSGTELENESARGSDFVYENEEEPESNPMPSAADYEDLDGQEGEENDENKGNKRPGSSQFGQSEYGTAPEESDTSDDDDDEEEDDEPAHEDDTVFYDCTDVISSYLSNTSQAASKEASESETSDEENEGEQVDSKNNNGYPTTPITPFVPHFTAKLNDPSGKYTEKDLQVELYGMMMESYCVWLEGLRLSFTNAQSGSTAHDNDPESCPHLGYWKKEFEISECQSCHRWRPIYTLTCPGCGVNRCVGCKFLAGRQG